MSALSSALTAVVTAVFLSISLCAQDPRGTILGRITDPSGAVVAGADVRVTNVATGVAAGAKTNEAGNYVLPYLLPGVYTLQAELAGFKKFVREAIQVRVADSVEVNVPMQLGDIAESIEVKEETPLLSTAEASLGQVVDERRLVELPVYGGSPMDLVHLAPGTINTTDLRIRKTSQIGSASSFAADGAGLWNNDFTVDGVTNTQSYGGSGTVTSRVALIPPSTAISEFKVQTTSFDASVGHTMGALLNVSTKSGTNEYHGEAHWFGQSRIFNAPNTFQNRSGLKPPVYQDNRYGLSGGGPVLIPKLYNGKNKTFWFYAWEADKFNIPTNHLRAVPTDAMRKGDLSELLGLGSTYQVYDPATTTSAPGGRFSRLPFAGNIIPPSRIDPVARNILEYWPRPNQPGTRDHQNNWFNDTLSIFDGWVHLARVDHAFHPNHRMYVRLNKDYYMEDENRTFVVGRPNPRTNVTRTIGDRDIRGVAFDDVYVFTPSFLFNFRYGLTQMNFDHGRATRGFDVASLGFSPRLLSLIPDKKMAAFPNVQVGVLQPLGGWVSGGDGSFSSQVHSFHGNFTRLLGDHSLRFGAEFRVYREYQNQRPLEVAPQLVFSSAYTRGPFDNSPAPPVGGELAAFLLGIPGGQMVRTTSKAEQDKYLGLFLHDDFKASARLTLNLGLRYELETPVTERFNRSVAHFAFDKPSPIEAQARANYAASPIPELPLGEFRVRGGLTFVNADGNPRTFWEGEKNNFMPRVGFAWQLLPKTVVRGGYGLFFNTIGINSLDSIQTGFSQSTPIQASLDGGLTFIATTADPFPAGLLAPLGAAGGLSTNLGQSISFFRVKRLHPYAQRWSVGIQQALPAQFLAEAAYVGNRGTRIDVNRNLNATPAQYLSRSPVRDQPTINFLSQQFPNPMRGTNPIYGANISRAGLLAPYPQFGGVSMAEPIGYSWYHSLQVRAERRFSRGYTFQLSYTWSKAMEAVELLNASDPRPYESISSLDRTHRLVMSGIWELPFGRGRRVGSGWPAALNFIAGGWQLNGMVQRQSGPPLGFGDVWTLFTGNPNNISLPKDQRTLERWFNVDAGFNRNSAQQLASNIRVSPLRFSGIRADGQARWDFSAIKNFRVTEKLKAQVRAECINAWNHPNMYTPNTSPTSGAFGSIARADVPRIWQMSLKMAF